MMRKEIDDKIRQFYIDNPRKFNYAYSTKSEYSISMKPFDESKKYQQLVSLYDSIGMGRAFDSRDDVNTCMITASTKNKKEEEREMSEAVPRTAERLDTANNPSLRTGDTDCWFAMTGFSLPCVEIIPQAP